MSHNTRINAIEWRDDTLILLDQRLLPAEECYLSLKDAPAVAQAIKDMVVRGAPAIGIAAAYAVALSVQQALKAAGEAALVVQDIERLAHSRPTAVNLGWALAQMQALLQQHIEGRSLKPTALPALLALAQQLHAEDVAANQQMAAMGAALLPQDAVVLTHCNTGALATAGHGTALGVIRTAFAQGKLKQVYANETRPWLQGSRLTAWELAKEAIPVALLVDSAAASLMRTQAVHWVIVGADRITANGDVANKIGTYTMAVLARQHGVKFMVVAPSSTVDMQLGCGDDIPIEHRAATEISQVAGQQLGAVGVNAWNPVFDVTPAALIDVIVTEKGLIHAPDREKMLAIFA